MARHGWRQLTTLFTVAGVVAAGNVAAVADHESSRDVVIRRTAHGVPHILASNYRGLGEGVGYAYAEDNLCVLADTVLTVSAERSRWFGPDARTVYGDNNLVSDLYHQQVNQSRVVEKLLTGPGRPSRQVRDMVRGYAAGYNRYLAHTGVANLPDPACRGARWVRPISELDVWRRIYQIIGLSSGEALQQLVVSAAPPGAAATGSAPDASVLERARPQDLGSNAYGLGRQATQGHTGMLLANPHFPWQGDRRFYQQHLTIPGELNVIGVGLHGMPVVGIGHNDRLAWTHTVSTAQTFTLTKLTLAPGDPTRYLVDGRLRHMSSRAVTVRVRQPDGSLAPVTRTLFSTEDGPVVEIPGALDWSTTTAYALRDANAGNLRAADQWLAMGRARDVGELRAAQARHQGVPWVNTTAADSTGTAYYGDIQVVPHVTDEELARCATEPDIGLVILDGSRSSCGWGSDPDAAAPGLLGPSRLPTLTRRDFVSNMNDSPWLANPAAPLTGYPRVVGDIGTERSPRTRLGLDMIADRLDGSDDLGRPGFTLSSLQATMFGNRDLTAEQGRASVVAMCQANPTLPASDGRQVDVRQACAALAGWDGRGEVDARGALLWRKLIDLVARRGVDIWKVPFDPADPAHTPRDIDGGQPGVRLAFADVVQIFGSLGVPVDLPLGAVQHYAGVPIHGCAGREGCFNAINVDGVPGPDGVFPDVAHGTSFLMATELTRNGPRTRTLLSYGQSANVDSPLHTDQTRLYRAKQWVTERFTEREIAHDPELTVRRLN